MYIDKILPFVREGELVKSYDKVLNISEIFIPIKVDEPVDAGNRSKKLKVLRVLPLNIYVLDESDSVCVSAKEGKFGGNVLCAVTDIDYEDVAERIEITGNDAGLFTANAYRYEDDIITDSLVNLAANGISGGELLEETLREIEYKPKNAVSFSEFMNNVPVDEALDMNSLIGSMKKNGSSVSVDTSKDYVYKWLNSYFALPEGEEMKSGSREVVPLLIGPTGVFKSATIKELCRKYDYRLVDFRVSFTSRLDYSGLYQITQVDGESFSYSCPMEELVTCSDGFREYCRKAYAKIEEIIKRGYIVKSKVSSGSVISEEKADLTDEQKEILEKTKASYKEYMKTPVLFLDEITRCKDAGVEGILVTLLNQKRFNSMTMNGCKFVAATNLNLMNGNTRHDSLMPELDDMYDVNDSIDVAYANRFMPLKVLPEDVKDRWFEWASGSKVRQGKTIQNIHSLIIDFLKINPDLVYNESPVLDAIENGLNDEEKKAQTFPNYRTWEMLSDYVTESENSKVFRSSIINGLISAWAGEKFCKYLKNLGWEEFVETEDTDDVGDFMESSLDAGVPAMIIGPSSMGKTSRVKAYEKKLEARTGKKPIRFDINLSSMDAVDIMGMPTKKSLTEYVSNQSFKSSGMSAVDKELASVIKGIQENQPELGLPAHMTVRAPDLEQKEKFERAVKEGRDIIIFFDECNRVKNPVIMSAMFEAISDYRLFGVSFKHIKDRVKIIGACNMSHSESSSNLDGEEADYSNAGSLDPALAARFSIKWKKNYDAKDARSFIRFLESERDEGKIDGTLVEFLKQMDVEDVIKTIASVEKRSLENAEPSTRMMYQFSKDVMCMRGKRGSDSISESLFAGKVIFNDATTRKFSSITEDGETNAVVLANRYYDLCKKILRDAKDWEPALKGTKVICSGEETTGDELVRLLKDMMDAQRAIVTRPMTPESESALADINSATDLVLNAMLRLDREVSESRKEIFEAQLGSSFARKFLPFFNENFGTVNDTNITISMLSDEELIDPYVGKIYNGVSSKGVDAVVKRMVTLINEFHKEFGTSLPPKNYSILLECIKEVVPSYDSMAEILNLCGAEQDPVFAKAEQTGDEFIKDMLKVYPGTFGSKEIDDMRSVISGRGSSGNKKKKSRVL